MVDEDGTTSALVTLPLDYEKTCGTPAKKEAFLGELESNVNDFLDTKGLRHITCPTAQAGSVIAEIRGPRESVDAAVQGINDGLIKLPGAEDDQPGIEDEPTTVDDAAPGAQDADLKREYLAKLAEADKKEADKKQYLAKIAEADKKEYLAKITEADEKENRDKIAEADTQPAERGIGPITADRRQQNGNR